MRTHRIRERIRWGAASCVALALLFAGCAAPAPAGSRAAGTQPLVRTSEGLLRGRDLAAGIAAFRGVPYARPPVGALRWRPPRPPEAWSGIRDAGAFGPACPQGRGTEEYYRRAARRLGRDSARVPKLGPTAEDCLYLNVWTTGPTSRGPLPVFVWIHGGAGTTGTGSDPLFRGDRLARHGAVVITLNYRLGPLGFLAHPALSREDPHRVSGNYALHDVVRALEWIRENAVSFGGDPGRITLAGQSSGASLIQMLMVAPAAQGLFHRVVLQSATWVEPPPLRGDGGVSTAEAAGTRFLERLGVGADAGAAVLRDLPVDSLLVAARRAGPDAPSTAVVDGRFLPAEPALLWASGAFANVPMLRGSTGDEFALFMPPVPLPPGEYERWVRERYDSLAPLVLETHPPGEDAESARRQRVRVLSEQAFRAPSVLLLRWAGGRTPIYLYRFGWRPDDGRVGAFHGVDLPFLFGTHRAAGWWEVDPGVRRLTRAIQEAWIRFAATGRPGAPSLPQWAAARSDPPGVMRLEAPPRLGSLTPRPLLHRLADRLEARLRTPGTAPPPRDTASR